MKKTKVTITDLAVRTQALENQINRVKGRLDSLSFHRHKHGNRLKLLAGDSEQLGKRLNEVEQQLPNLLSMGGKRLAKRWHELRKQYKALRKSPPKPPSEKVPTKLKKLHKGLKKLSGKQQGLQSALTRIAGDVSRAADGSDGLRRETEELKGQISKLEETGSGLLEISSNQESRILNAETLLSELASSRQHEALQAALQPELDGLHSSLAELVERISKTTEGTASLKLESEDLKRQIRDLEETGAGLTAASSSQDSRILDAETLLSELASSRQDDTWQRTLEAEVDALQRGLEQLRKDAFPESGGMQDIDLRLQQLTEPVAGLEDTLPGATETAEDQAGTSDRLSLDFEPRLASLEAQVSRLDSLLEQFDGQVAGSSGDLDKRLGWVESEVIRLTESTDMLQEGVRELGGQELDTNARLEKLSQMLAEFTRDNDRLKSGVHSLSGEVGQAGATISLRMDESEQRLDSLGDLVESIQGRLDSLQQSQNLLKEDERPYAHLHHEITGQLDRIEEAAIADRERVDQIQVNLDQVREQGESWRQLNEEVKREHNALEGQLGTLNDQLQTQTDQLDKLLGRVETLPDGAAGEQALSARLDELEHGGRLTADQLAELGKAHQALQAQMDNARPAADTASRTIEAIRASIDEVAGKGSQLEEQVNGAIATGRSNRMALAILTALALLGGYALYRQDAETILATDRQLADLLSAQSESDQARQRLERQFGELESSLTATNRRIEQIPRPALSGDGPVEEARVMRIEAQLENLSSQAEVDSPLAAAVSSLDEKMSRTGMDLQNLERRLGAFESTLADLTRDKDAPRTALSGANVEETRITQIEAQIADLASRGETEPAENAAVSLLDQRVGRTDLELQRLGTRLNLLESRDPKTADTTGAMQHLDSIRSSITELSERLALLERREQEDREQQKVLHARVEEFAASLTALEEQPPAREPSKDHTSDWTLASTRGSYTIQLAGAYHKASILYLYGTYGLDGEMTFFRTRFNDRDWYVLLYGIFDNLTAASQALHRLPDPLRQFKPWIRRVPADGAHVPQ